MCGIAGLVSIDSGLSNDELRLQVGLMNQAIKHRGPDGEGITDILPGPNGARILLAHRRLSIVDIDGGQQPMEDVEGNAILTFNGEIYNFEELRSELQLLGIKFKTTSDTEVLLAAYLAYGNSCIERLNGMYAFAIWNARTQELFFARDRFGKKPFFYQHDDQGLRFASELKSLVACSPGNLTVNPTALWHCSLLRYVPGEHTLYSGIKKLEPGTTATYYAANNKITFNKYYSPPDTRAATTASRASRTDEVIQSEFLNLLEDAVVCRTNCDVSFGAFLSGGIDSAAVVGLMSRHLDTPVKTFSVGFEQEKFSELPSAELIAEQFKTEHTECVIRPEDIVKYLPEAVRFRDGPVSEPSDVPILLLSRVASESVKMVLTGEGSDEVLGGYPKHAYERFGSVLEKSPLYFRNLLSSASQRYVPERYNRLKIGVSSLCAKDYSDRMQCWFGSMPMQLRSQLFKKAFIDSLDPSQMQGFGNCGGSALRDILAFDQTVWLPNNLLERGDRMTMAASIEARMPFMDYRLAEFVSELPDKYRVRGTQKKWLLRKAMVGLLPESIINRKKMGFKVPMSLWFRTSLLEYLKEHLLGSDSRLNEFTNTSFVNKLISEHANGSHNHEKILWSLLNLELWLQQADGNEYKDKVA